jgi:hypothetical protein
MILPISRSQVAGITGVSRQHPAKFSHTMCFWELFVPGKHCADGATEAQRWLPVAAEGKVPDFVLWHHVGLSGTEQRRWGQGV